MKGILRLAVYVILTVIIMAVAAEAQAIPKVSVELGESTSPKDLSATLQIVLMLTVLTLAPSIILMMTSFVRIVVVLGFLRQAIGTQQLPPNQLLIGLALILTFFIVSPMANKAYDEGLKPYLDEQISRDEAFEKGIAPFKQFMLEQTREKDLGLFIELAGMEPPEKPEDVPLHVLIPGFVISELRIAFQISFLIFVPFLIIDMIVSSVLMSMGMMMLPPIIVALPFKILLFILVDGWYLLVKSLVGSFY
ncbi:MAG: flagellar biosynthetic protein FliP [candidate division Zixibacteria bacterium HGW-Zixibacteria-1]|nr:MAG: flagellar biosynthetic protein FliP [candidate division Zixibacteria bacterium HGW-Zixibacteria-1]